ncbi:helix-turn-helix domain-containing protein [Laribacter hongkongensis]|uniref:helix-turn-helix domain-containing protein n=1 Tax=Laribacter hongkongensis TaxID=168471 RepID=UPI0009D6E5DC|nr:helix-turn-helix transcriptional regulator [Laribacter hongkongensis]MCG8996379.1 helix-turn-helix domain-containing protein [Laribacter hongkongensis]MCG9011587.1 helix-turn-helix domain-containing protein [Laribacter hongkongensis]MCG9023983.1 helix-turn-helix domain-containing protein [Laribacter hongkongensis]MCG9048018.1 helix-turn-helix domain-containing protein [Laribacter hongkongensis]MCG9075069.1 helix-turn-helix domain-containing protein [Laribacter hongkongensis]
MNIKKSELGARLRAEKLRLGLTQRDMARLGGVSPATYSGYENNKSVPTLEFVIQLANHGVDPWFLMFGVPSPDALAPDEGLLLMDYRSLGPQEKFKASVAIRQLGLSGSASAATASSDTAPSAPSASGAVISHNTGDDTTINTGTLINIGLDDGVKPPAKRRTAEKKKPAK